MTCRAELIARALNPGNWGALSSENRGRSELAAQFYDEMLFHGVTFADLDRGTGPLILASATDISTGARLAFMQYDFDFLCSDLNAVPLSRAAAASSAVPFVLTPMTLNTYGGTCKFAMPKRIAAFGEPETAPRPAARALKTRKDLQAYQDGVHRPYIYPVDGGLADNLGMRSALEVLQAVEARSILGQPTPLDLDRGDRRADRPLFVRGGRAVERHDGPMADHAAYSGFGTLPRNHDPEPAELARAPDIELHVIDVSFPVLKDKAEVEYLNNLPTSFVLPHEAVDRLRAAARTIILSSPELRRLLEDAGAKLVMEPAPAANRVAP